MTTADQTYIGAPPAAIHELLVSSSSPAQRFQSRLRAVTTTLVLTDLFVTAVWTLICGSLLGRAGVGAGAIIGQGLTLAALVPLFGLIAGIYSRGRVESGNLGHVAPMAGTLAAAGLVSLLIATIAETVPPREAALGILLGLPPLFLALILVRGAAARWALRTHPERVLIVGAGAVGQRLARRIMEDPARNAEVVGFVDDFPLPIDEDLRGIRVFPASGSLTNALVSSRASRLAIAFSGESAPEILDLVRWSEAGPVPISVVPRFFEITPAHARVAELAGLPVVNLSSGQLSRSQQVAKRLLDLTLSLAGGLLLAPVLLGIAVAIKLGSPGPVLFRQERVGRDGKVFRIYKFRTMIAEAEASREALAAHNDMVNAGPLFKMRNDPRTTPFGRTLRRLNLDELPQLINVVRGQMSLVGPRPFVTQEAHQINDWGARRKDLMPGMTGLWQISGRSELSYEEMIQLDYLYVSNWSVWWDLRLLLKTIPLVLSGRAGN